MTILQSRGSSPLWLFPGHTHSSEMAAIGLLLLISSYHWAEQQAGPKFFKLKHSTFILALFWPQTLLFS